MMQHQILQDSWVWNGIVSDFVRQYAHGRVLNVCAGLSDIGDVRIDLDPKNPDVIKADMNAIPYPNDSFDVVIEDPPWKIGFYKRMRPFFEAVRVCKVGGLIVYNAYWVPSSKATQLIRAVIRQDKPFTNTSIVSVLKKITDDYDEPTRAATSTASGNTKSSDAQ